MKKFAMMFAAIMLVAAFTICPVDAAEQKKLGVLPFTVHSSENLDYVRSGVWDMLISRLSSGEEINVADKETMAAAFEGTGGKDLVASDAYEIGKRLGLDFVVWGSITKIGNSVSLDGKLLDVDAYTTPVGVFEQTRGMDDVIPKISEFARKISAHVRGEKFSDEPETVSPPVIAPPPGPREERARELSPRTGEPVDVLQSGRGTLTSVINPSFIMTPEVLDRRGFVMSSRYPRKFKGMDVGDVDGDGKNEIVVIDRTNIFIYRFEESGFVLKHTLAGKSYDNYISVDVADINENEIPEIIVTNMRRDRLYSFVVEYREDSFITILDGVRRFLRVIETADGPCLLGQEMGLNAAFENPIHEMVWEGENLRDGRRMPIPKGLSVFGTTLASLDGGRTERVIALDVYDRLNVFQKTSKPLQQIYAFGAGQELLWRSDDAYGGTDNLIEYTPTDSGIDDTHDIASENAYANVRILTYDLKGDGKNEVILVKNRSPVGRLLQNVKIFNRSEIYGFEWDGLGLLENWKTKAIQGYVTDYQFKDLNNDGKKQIVLALVLPTSQSVIVAYDLNL
ncbi:MAG: hypothetical protein AVO39_01975 [delta proteobacterium MLS_D]|jgi:TolB-like protein|nr:MAG: hypothetical protein AVO39_01975 [delta proteobacterium MLS_D]